MTGTRKCEVTQLKRQGQVGIGSPRYLPGSTPHQLTHLGLACPAGHARGTAEWQRKMVALSRGIQLRGGCRELRLAPGLRAQE